MQLETRRKKIFACDRLIYCPEMHPFPGTLGGRVCNVSISSFQKTQGKRRKTPPS